MHQPRTFQLSLTTNTNFPGRLRIKNTMAMTARCSPKSEGYSHNRYHSSPRNFVCFLFSLKDSTALASSLHLPFLSIFFHCTSGPGRLCFISVIGTAYFNIKYIIGFCVELLFLLVVRPSPCQWHFQVTPLRNPTNQKQMICQGT